jgi:predicted outer membrane repeat protein
VISGGEIVLSGVTMSECKGTNGGAIYSTISGAGKLTIKDTNSFTGC